MKKIIDLRSDTVKMPTDEMRKAMAQAPVGDDVFGEDPTANKLEATAAKMLGKEAACFTASGTMSNLIGILANTRPGDEVIMGTEAHMYWNEVGGAAAMGGVMTHLVPNDEDGRMAPEDIISAIRPKNIHYPVTTLLCLENTHNRCGGAVLTPEYTKEVSDIAHKNGMKVHLDGARIFNAAIALGIPAAKLSEPADSVCFCISKGLCAPIGSLICGSKEYIERVRKWRKMLGGGMRQIGIICAAGIISLEKMVSRLKGDHDNAKRLARGLAKIPGIGINPDKVQTNIVVFEIPPAFKRPDFTQKMNALGVKLSGGRGTTFVRAVTYAQISSADIDTALERIESLVVGKVRV